MNQIIMFIQYSNKGQINFPLISKRNEMNIIYPRLYNIVIIRMQSAVISNFDAITFEYHQFLFQFWKGICILSRNISDNLVTVSK